jgi:hypothetical protein
MIDFEHSQAWVRVAVGVGIESSAENNVLADSPRYCVGEQVFGVTAAGHEERPEGDRMRSRLIRRIAAGSAVEFLRVRTKNSDRQRVLKDERTDVEELVRGTA